VSAEDVTRSINKAEDIIAFIKTRREELNKNIKDIQEWIYFLDVLERKLGENNKEMSSAFARFRAELFEKMKQNKA
jgi:prefoldin subunit 5